MIRMDGTETIEDLRRSHLFITEPLGNEGDMLRSRLAPADFHQIFWRPRDRE